MTKLSAEAVARLREDIEFSEELLGERLNFRTTWGLFSPREIDAGSLLLLDHIKIASDSRILDLGCGYGALGIALGKSSPANTVTLVDKDFVAVEYCRRNIQLNAVDNCTALLSNGLNQVQQTGFEIVVTNLPAKSGKELYYLMFHDVYERLSTGGRFYIVTINGLREFVKRHFVDIFGNYKKLKQGKTYTVAVAEKC